MTVKQEQNKYLLFFTDEHVALVYSVLCSGSTLIIIMVQCFAVLLILCISERSSLGLRNKTLQNKYDTRGCDNKVAISGKYSKKGSINIFHSKTGQEADTRKERQCKR